MVTSQSLRLAYPGTNAFWCINIDHFAFRKIDKAFYIIAKDQPHNQNIAVIKAYRGTIGPTEDNYQAFFSVFLPILSNLQVLGGLQKGILVTKL